ncbi:MAG: hypothetical protein H6839_03240 [Planctomycetes bacterium]|nr:hypothetical protein [Planctomycetota bacterium]
MRRLIPALLLICVAVPSGISQPAPQTPADAAAEAQAAGKSYQAAMEAGWLAYQQQAKDKLDANAFRQVVRDMQARLKPGEHDDVGAARWQVLKSYGREVYKRDGADAALADLLLLHDSLEVKRKNPGDANEPPRYVDQKLHDEGRYLIAGRMLAQVMPGYLDWRLRQVEELLKDKGLNAVQAGLLLRGIGEGSARSPGEAARRALESGYVNQARLSDLRKVATYISDVPCAHIRAAYFDAKLITWEAVSRHILQVCASAGDMQTPSIDPLLLEELLETAADLAAALDYLKRTLETANQTYEKHANNLRANLAENGQRLDKVDALLRWQTGIMDGASCLLDLASLLDWGDSMREAWKNRAAPTPDSRIDGILNSDSGSEALLKSLPGALRTLRHLASEERVYQLDPELFGDFYKSNNFIKSRATDAIGLVNRIREQGQRRKSLHNLGAIVGSLGLEWLRHDRNMRLKHVLDLKRNLSAEAATIFEVVLQQATTTRHLARVENLERLVEKAVDALGTLHLQLNKKEHKYLPQGYSTSEMFSVEIALAENIVNQLGLMYEDAARAFEIEDFGPVIMSRFEEHTDGWVQAGVSKPLLWEDGAVRANPTEKDWVFFAPPKFTGDLSRFSGRYLRFRLKGDASGARKAPASERDFTLLISGKVNGKQITLTRSIGRMYGSQWTDYKIPLSAAGGWTFDCLPRLVDDKDFPRPASNNDVREVLKSIGFISIVAEYYEDDRIWLDDVIFGAQR